jgi:hypothetical protein
MANDRADSEDEYTRGFTELPDSMFDDGSRVITAPFTPKEVAHINPEKRLSKKVIWSIVTIVTLSLGGLIAVIALSSSQTS